MNTKALRAIPNANNQSGLKGVETHQRKNGRLYRASLRVNGAKLHGPYRKRAKTAFRDYQSLVATHFGQAMPEVAPRKRQQTEPPQPEQISLEMVPHHGENDLSDLQCELIRLRYRIGHPTEAIAQAFQTTPETITRIATFKTRQPGSLPGFFNNKNRKGVSHA